MKWKLKCNEIEWNGNYHSLNGSIFKLMETELDIKLILLIIYLTTINLNHNYKIIMK